MKVLIRSIDTELYMDLGKWVEDINRARDFKTAVNAVECVMECELKNIEIIQSFEDPTYNFSTGPITL